MDEYKLLRKKYKKKETEPKFKKILFSIINQVLICAVLFLGALIATKNRTYKEIIYKYVYGYHFSFAEIEEYYQKYFGKLMPIQEKKDSDRVEAVVSEKLQYERLEEIPDGVKLKVGKERGIVAVESGLVLFVGEKEGFGTTLILEQVDGVEVWYVGINTHDLTLYDYVEKSSIIGTSKEEDLSIYFKKKGEVVDYKNYLS